MLGSGSDLSLVSGFEESTASDLDELSDSGLVELSDSGWAELPASSATPFVREDEGAALEELTSESKEKKSMRYKTVAK